MRDWLMALEDSRHAQAAWMIEAGITEWIVLGLVFVAVVGFARFLAYLMD